MAEAVGIVLALAPLVISCFEDYGEVAKFVKAFKKYTKLVKNHTSVLNIQQTIFLKANERLLGQCLNDVEEARRMLADRSHCGWSDEGICSLYVERLAGSRQAFEDSVALITSELATIKTTLSTFDVTGNEHSDDASSLKKKIKYAFKQSNIDVSLKNLTEKTRDFVSLVDLTGLSEQRTTLHKSSIKTRKQISRFSEVQENAFDLYQALGHACTKHTGHQAHLSLQPICADPTQVKFTIAFSQLSLTPSQDEQSPCSKSTWLTVESRLTGRIQSTIANEPMVHTQQALKRALNEDDQAFTSPTCPKKLVKKRVQILVPPTNNNVVKVMPHIPAPALTNLCTHSNFCNRLQKFVAESKPCSAAVGYLELSGSSKHLIYVDSKSQTVTRTQPATGTIKSLRKMLRAAKSDITQSSSFSVLHKIRLAHQLATAVLQFHATPWLRRSWSSDEVLISLTPMTTHYGDNGNRLSPEAYVSAQIHGPNGPLTRVATSPSPIVVRNLLLFRLGVMLLEIAYASPLSDMTIDRDRQTSDPVNTEYFTADRLCRQVSAHMGPKYAEITRKCIHCDFGCDFDLKLSKLQEGFHQDVICELEKLEERMKEW